MIPMKFLSKMYIYDSQIQDATVKVRVIDRADVVNIGLSELRSHMATTSVVGLEIKSEGRSYTHPTLVKLCARNYCLSINFGRFCSYNNPSLKGLKDFLSDPEICFMGIGLRQGLQKLQSNDEWKGLRGVEVGDLAAKVLKKSDLISKPGVSIAISRVADEVGVSLDELHTSMVPAIDLDHDEVFSHKQIKCMIHDVYASYLVGSKLLGSRTVECI